MKRSVSLNKTECCRTYWMVEQLSDAEHTNAVMWHAFRNPVREARLQYVLILGSLQEGEKQRNMHHVGGEKQRKKKVQLCMQCML